MIDYAEILQNLIVFFAGSSTVWVFSKILKLSKDLDRAFIKIRNLEALNDLRTNPDK